MNCMYSSYSQSCSLLSQGVPRLVLRVMSLLTTHDTAQPSPPQPMASPEPLSSLRTQNSSPAAFIRSYRSRSHENSQAIITVDSPVTVSRHWEPVCSQSLYFRPCRKNCQKVCRKFQEAVIGSAATGHWARHWHRGPWRVRILNIATKFSSELGTSDQVPAHVTNERFS